MKWYESNTGDHQGLVIDEETGENIAVTYKKENARLVAAAPDLLEACEMALTEYRHLKDKADKNELGCTGNDDACTNLLNYVINKAKEG